LSSFQLKGFSQVSQRIRDISAQMKNNAKSSTLEMAEIVRDRAFDYCPDGDEPKPGQDKLNTTIRVVEKESGIEQGRNDSGQFTSGAVITFAVIAGNEHTPHALAVHEHPSKHSPPSWQNTTVHFRKGGPKFLERALKDEAGNALDRIGRKVIR
jgi:hypothetical protein